jgi:hypothetical protein
MLLHEADGSFTQFGGVFRRSSHGPHPLSECALPQTRYGSKDVELALEDVRRLLDHLVTLRRDGRIFTEDTHQPHLAVTLTGIAYAILLTLPKHISSFHIGGTSAVPEAIDGDIDVCQEFLSVIG